MNAVAPLEIPSPRLTRRAFGARDAFEEELLGLQKELFFYARRWDRQGAEDLVQIANERALKARQQFAPGTNMKGWLITIIKNHLKDQGRRQRGKQFVELDVDLPAPSATEPLAKIHSEVCINFIRESVSLLPSRQRQAVEISLDTDPEYQQDIARPMGLAASTVKTHFLRARKNIRQRALAIGFVP